MFRLRFQTKASWLDMVLSELDTLLLEQAHLERKAAMSAMTLTFRYPEAIEFQRPLGELAREEMEHFDQVLEIMERRGIPYGPIQPSPYPGRLLAAVRDNEPERLLDQLLCNAVIEARSCERLKLLGEALAGKDAELSQFYSGIVASEARHHGLYVSLAKQRFPSEVVDQRLDELIAHEADVLDRAPAQPRLHN